jgi:hypothetical protein
VAPLAARSPKLRRALAAAKDAGYAYVVIDGTLIPIDRVAADWPFYSGKHRHHGMNLQVISAPDGEIMWVSGPRRGGRHRTRRQAARAAQPRPRPGRLPHQPDAEHPQRPGRGRLR